MTTGNVLDGLHGPQDLRALPSGALPALAQEIRDRLIETVSDTGGHLGPNLGVVELTIALHRCFDSPTDAIVWDTGHQSYVHKMLTGRQHDFASLRQGGGLSGYPSRAESQHDLVENSHASTALSYADGLAKGFELSGSGRTVIAVVGDGALTGGMSWEALNNLGRSRRRVIVVLNDNGRSYEPTVGSLAEHLRTLREDLAPATFFTDLGLDYLGPVDGHDIAALEIAFGEGASRPGPVVIHCVTAKGAGHLPAESDEADRFHTVSPRPRRPGTATSGPGWTSSFSDELVHIGERRSDVVAVTAAMLRPNGLLPFAQRFPDRVFDVGIAEQHAVTSAAGLAMAGLHPVVALYATFLNRAFDQVLMDVALHGLGVTFVLNRAGITGPDGPSHHGMWDVPILGLIPGLRIAAPRDTERLRELLGESLEDCGPTALRFPTGTAPAALPSHGRIGSADVLTRWVPTPDVLLIPVGSMATAAVEAAAMLHRQELAATVADPRWISPIDPALLLAAADHRAVLTIEDNAVSGGFGDSFARGLRTAGLQANLVTLGLASGFLDAGERDALLTRNGLDAPHIAASARSALESVCPFATDGVNSLPAPAPTEPMRRDRTAVSRRG